MSLILLAVITTLMEYISIQSPFFTLFIITSNSPLHWTSAAYEIISAKSLSLIGRRFVVRWIIIGRASSVVFREQFTQAWPQVRRTTSLCSRALFKNIYSLAPPFAVNAPPLPSPPSQTEQQHCPKQCSHPKQKLFFLFYSMTKIWLCGCFFQCPFCCLQFALVRAAVGNFS